MYRLLYNLTSFCKGGCLPLVVRGENAGFKTKINSLHAARILLRFLPFSSTLFKPHKDQSKMSVSIALSD